MSTLGLCMIVRDEAQLIERCLDSVKSLVDYYCISDTGSTDGTQRVIRNWLDRNNRPGEVFDTPWQDFGSNRTIALEQLWHREVDYALMLDADDVLVTEPSFDPEVLKRSLTHDVYHLEIRHGTLQHARAQICRNNGSFRYRGVLHEFLDGPQGYTTGTVGQCYIVAGTEGSRSKDPGKYGKDAETLRKALLSETDPYMRARYTFYLGQSYRDSNQPKRALEAYQARSDMGFWDQEVAMSLHRMAEAMIQLHRPPQQVIGQFLAAWEAFPQRVDSLYGAARYCREMNKFHQGYLFARHALSIPPFRSGLFAEPWIHQYGLLDELSVSGYWSGHYTEALWAAGRLLTENLMPDPMRARVSENYRLCCEKVKP